MVDSKCGEIPGQQDDRIISGFPETSYEPSGGKKSQMMTNRQTETGTSDGAILECRGIERRFGGIVAVTGVDMVIQPQEIFGLVGPNGSGKTTLTNAITGFYPPNVGSIRLAGNDITGTAPHKVAKLGVARTFQNLALFNGMSVLDNILLGRHIHMNPGVFRTCLLYTSDAADE